MTVNTGSIDTLRAALEKLLLWQHFQKVATEEQQVMVAYLVRHADGLLSRIIETFPTYTLHDRTHAINVAHLMGTLIEPWLDQLTALETGLLILSAFWHDVGMVFSEEERAAVADSEEFETFLRTYPEARLEVADGGLSRSMMEWFCRWCHADRVFHHLNTLDERHLEWNGISLRQQLGNLCRSHNLAATELQQDDLCPTDFLATADVRLCSVLLRLADILDFDRSRSPESIYRYLNIHRRSDPRQKASDVEWLKHLQSSGFHFPDIPNRRIPYALRFVAAPDQPAVEWDVRAFLDIIEDELLQGQQLVRHSSARWRDVALPDRVLRHNILSKNYKFGDYRFLLDQEQVLGLLMGNNLYENPYVFIRELLQNALDTSRHREFYERSRGTLSFTADPIVVTEWYDDQQYRWIRIDDYGMGMTEEIIEKFLLHVGRSYYTSAEFRAEQLKYVAQAKFTPISRFGIGLLSCFIVGDRIEISTRHVKTRSRSDSIRLSLSGLHGFFTLQTSEHIPDRMPSMNGNEPGYRSRAGTSLAVRLDPRKEESHLDVRRTLNRYILCPPIPVEYRGEAIGGDPTQLVEHPWLDAPVEVELGEEILQLAHEKHAIAPSTKVYVRFVPINLTAHSPRESVRGQLVAAFTLVHSPYKELEEDHGIRRTVDLQLLQHGLISHFRVHVSSNAKLEAEVHESLQHLAELRRSKGRQRTLKVDISSTLGALHPIVLEVLSRDQSVGLSHNGILFPSAIQENDPDWGSSLEPIFVQGRANVLVWGVISLQDEMRPDLSVSRDALKSLPVSTSLAVELAFSRALRSVPGAVPAFSAGLMLRGIAPQTLLMDIIDYQDLSRRGPWNDEPLFERGRKAGPVTPNALRAQVADEGVNVEFSIYQFIQEAESWSARELVRRVLLQRDFACVLDDTSSARTVRIHGERVTPLTHGELFFPPLTFMPFENSNALRHSDFLFLNTRHPFSEWLLTMSPRIHEQFPGMFHYLRTSLVQRVDDRSELDEWLREVNVLIDRMRLAAPDLVPSDLRLTNTDLSPL